ncbi:MAG: VTT domain-containing protein [Archaeoglobi archaeon]|nr:VTT domain-containing protein [Candidatus Mnemosynella bozhongmuii]
MQSFQTLLQNLSALGILGVFLISLVANSIPFVGIPYLNFLIVISPALNSFQLLSVSILSALGAATGKVIIYFTGKTFRLALSEDKRRNLEFFARLLDKWGIFAIFFFAATPMPDDALYFPLGVGNYSLKNYFIAVLAGKIFLTSSVLMGGKILFRTVERLQMSFEMTFLIFMLLTFGITAIILKIDWMKLFEKYRRYHAK